MSACDGPLVAQLPRASLINCPRMLSSEDPPVGMKPSSSLPFFPRDSSLSNFFMKQPLIIRRHSTSDNLYNNMRDSPLHDLAPIAIPGLHTRVTRASSVATSLDGLLNAFGAAPDSDEVVVMEGGCERR